MTVRRLLPVIGAIAALGVGLTSCSINRLAVNVLADTLAGTDGDGVSTFTTDADPQLVGDALPFALKLFESILEQTPRHEGLLLATGSGFISYANAFVATPASMLPFYEWDQKESMQRRAKALYLRGREYVIRGLDVRYSGFRDALFATDAAAVEPYLARMRARDVAYLYWIGAGWVAAFGLDPFDLELAFSVPRALPLMLRAVELDDGFNDGALHDFLLQYYASVPPTMGGDRAKAQYHYERLIRIANGRLAGPYISYAETFAIPSQDVDLFMELMERALAVDADAYPDARLVNVLSQRKAAWYLANIEEFFLLDWPEEEEDAF